MRIRDWSSDVCSSDLEAYESITKRLDTLRAGDHDQILKISAGLEQLLARAGIEAEISGREKHPYSIWKKMSERHVSLEAMSNLMAFGASVRTAEDCDRALGDLHRRWPMVQRRFQAHSQTPTRNGSNMQHSTLTHADTQRNQA